MRALLILAGTLLAFPLTAHAQLGRSASALAHDERVEHALDAEGWSYEIDSDGDFKMVISFSEEDRSQLVYVISRTHEANDLEIREVWSPVYRTENGNTVPAEIAQWALEQSWDLTIGSLAASPDGKVYFVGKIDADAPAPVLSSIIRIAASTGDELEKMQQTGDDL